MDAAPVLLSQCAGTVSPVLMAALVRTESAWNPFAIGMDSAQGSVSQPTSRDEAIAVAKRLLAEGRRFSVGLAQIHVSNVQSHRLTWEQAFDPCVNLGLGQRILWDFYRQATRSGYWGVSAVWAALRGYNSGGVHRAVSNDYANRIFAHMNAPGPGATAIQPMSTMAPKLPLRYVITSPRPTERTGESLDLFEKSVLPASAPSIGLVKVRLSNDQDPPAASISQLHQMP